MVSKTSSPPSTQMTPPHPSQLQQMSAGNVEARVSENPDSSEYLGARSPGLHKRLLGVLRRSSWVYFSWPSQLCVHLWLIHVSKCRPSQQALRILSRHQHLFCVAVRPRGRWLGGQLECKASHRVFERNRSSSPHQMSLECAEVTDHTLRIFTLIAFRWQGPQSPGNGLTEQQGQSNTKLQKTMIHRTTDSTTVQTEQNIYHPNKDQEKTHLKARKLWASIRISSHNSCSPGLTRSQGKVPAQGSCTGPKLATPGAESNVVCSLLLGTPLTLLGYFKDHSICLEKALCRRQGSCLGLAGSEEELLLSE